MGQEITHSHFSEHEFSEYRQRLVKETALFKQQFSKGACSSRQPVAGFEVEAWLIDAKLDPASKNSEFLQRFNNPLATSELAKFNIELNNEPLPLQKNCLQRFEVELGELFHAADNVAEAMDLRILLCGILPTLQPEQCRIENMSDMKRYKALNSIIFKARNGAPIKLDIAGAEYLKMLHKTVMLEAATTSFQVHLQTPWELAHHYYNAAIIASAPVMAVCGNSPFLFGKQLWHETRIPLFEQSVDTGSKPKRVSFGSGYVQDLITECFDENLQDYPVLLPMLFDDQQHYPHLRLHNGVIWRWNRPLIGFDDDGKPHVRIEHRIMPAGPTIPDMIANAAFFYGLTQSLMRKLEQEQKPFIPFDIAKDNFYTAARNGLYSEIYYGAENVIARHLVLDNLLDLAESGLQELNIDSTSISHYLGIIADRVASGQTGAAWQIEHFRQTRDSHELTACYLEHQHTNLPVHTWDP